MDPQKVSIVRDWPTPTTVTQLRAFLGLTDYYRRFIKSYASILGPLTELLKKYFFLGLHKPNILLSSLNMS